jgi:4-aminobutyrate aminotransferase/(S)-3-amino-2-methylpropionate transaminase
VTSNASLHERRMAAVPRGVANACAIYAERADNAELWDVEGRRYIDFAGGIAVLNTGHRHPKVMAAAAAQAERFTHTSFQVVPYESYIALAERLNALAPGDATKKAIFFTTGAEAIENAVKIARAATGRPGVIAFTGGYHGRTLMTLGLTGKISPYKHKFGPFPSDIFRAPFPNALHGVSVDDALVALDLLFRTDADPERIAAMVVEPVQGEGGYYIAPFEFLRALREICDQRGILLIADEIQSGFARTGRWFAIEHSGVVPDLIAVAKSLAGGFPLSGVIGRTDIMDAVPPGGLGGTYGGNPVACAAAIAAVQAIEEEGLLERSRELGERMVARLQDSAASNWLPYVSEVRGLGAMVSFELVTDRSGRAPNPELTAALTRRAAQNGLILLSCGLYGNVVRIMVPLTASDAIVEEGLDIIERSLREIVDGA